MPNIFEFPFLNPVRAIWQSDQLISNVGTTYLQTFNPAFNYKNLDSDFFLRLLKSYEEKVKYVQPFQQSDTIKVQWLGGDSVLGHYQHARLLTPNAQEYTLKPLTVVQESGGPYAGMYLYTITIPLYDLAEGQYFLQVAYNPGSSNQYVIFEPFDLKQIHKNTSLWVYRNSFNNQSVIYPSASYNFQLRLNGFVKELPPDATFNIYEDQPKNKELVSGTPFRAFEFIAPAIPDWMADKVNRITSSCDQLEINGDSYTREEIGEIEPVNPVDGYPLIDYKIKLGERYNISSLDIYGATIVLGNMPQTRYFWIEQMTIGSVVNIQMMFRGKRNFLDYLNATWLYSYGYWSEDAKGQLVFNPKPGLTPGGTYSLSAANVLSYGLRFLVIGAADFAVDIAAPAAGNFYAVVYGDGSANVNKTSLTTWPTTTVVAKTYLVNRSRELFIFFSNAKSIADNASNIDIREIGGDLPPGMTFFAPFNVNPQVERFENNIFKYVTAMEYFDIQGYNLDTYAINDLVRWIYETLNQWSTSADINIQGQTMVSPPMMSDPGIKYFVSKIIQYVSNLSTD